MDSAKLKKYRVYNKKWRNKNKDKINTYSKKYRSDNPEKIKTRNKNYYKNNPEKFKVKIAKYRSLKRGAKGSFTVDEWNDKVLEFDGCCAHCGVKLEENTQFEYNPNGISRDHVIALNNGGSNFIENILPACRRCNDSKSDKTDWVFKVR